MISILATDGLFEEKAEAALLRRVHDALAAAIDATDDPQVSSLIGITFQTVPKPRFLMGGTPRTAVRIDVAVPSIALSTFRRRRNFIRDATDAAIECANDTTIAERVIVRIAHLVDGGWGAGGVAPTNDEIDEGSSKP